MKARLYRNAPALLRHGMLWVALIAVLECVIFNLPFWESFSASSDSASYLNVIGSGLKRQPSGALTVVDPTHAYLQTTADSSSPFLRLDTEETTVHSTDHSNHESNTLKSYHVRADVDGNVTNTVSVSASVPQSLYIRANGGTDVKIWIMEAQGSTVDCTAVRADVHVPFRLDWSRVAVMVGLALLVEAWRPHSKLWAIRLDTNNPRQRLAFTGYAVALTALALYASVQAILHTTPLRFHDPGNYTYDFDQYGHLADALLHGHTWLDLPVPDALAKAANPYDPALREQLLHQGTTPIFWDYAFFNHHWYSYFGVLPAVLLYAPFRLISGLFVPGGLMLPSAAAMAFLLCGFLIFAALLVVRLTKRVAPYASVAGASMCVAVLLLGSNIGYLAFRLNFYSVPFSASLLLSAAGLWFWLGATKQNGKHMVRIGSAQALSWPHLAAGSACLAANLGCRPTFTLLALLALPMFWQQIKALCQQGLQRLQAWRHARSIHIHRRTHRPTNNQHAATVTLAAVLVPAAVIVIPLCLYNIARFGSPLSFGDHYQITVSDMTAANNPAANWLPTIGYYLLLPLRLTQQFPFMALNPTPLPHWSYTELMVGGIFTLCPALLLCVALPFMHRRMKRTGCFGTLLGCLMLACALLLVDTARGGLAWRYMADMGWLLALASMPAMVAVLGEGSLNHMANQESDIEPGSRSDALLENCTNWETSTHGTRPLTVWLRLHMPSPSQRHIMLVNTARVILGLLLIFSIVITLLSAFVPGRDDALQHNNQMLYHTVQSWFTLL